MKRVPITAAKRIADEYGYDQVLVYARATGKDGGEHMTTYGRTAEHCRIAGQTGDALKPLIDWSGSDVGKFLRMVAPAVKRPAMYAGDQGDRTTDEWLADAVRAYVGRRKGVEIR